MAAIVWLGTSLSDDIGVAANWHGGSLPVAGDDIICDDRAVNRMGSNLAALNSPVFRHFYVTRGYSARFGIPTGLQAKFTATGALVRIDGGDKEIVLDIDCSAFLLLGGNVRVVGDGPANGGLLSPTIQGGRLEVESGAKIASTTQLDGAVFLHEHASSTPTTWTIYGGRLDSKRSIPTLDVTDAQAQLLEAAAVSSAIYARRGSKVLHSSSGTVAHLYGYPMGEYSRELATRDATLTSRTLVAGFKYKPTGSAARLTETNNATVVGDWRDGSYEILA